jgi:hypothetical protein
MLGFCRSWVWWKQTWKVFQKLWMLLGKKGVVDGRFLAFICLSPCHVLWVGYHHFCRHLASLSLSLSLSLSSTWKFQSIVCTLTKYSLKEHVPAWFPILLSSFNKQTQSMFFNTHITTTLPSLVILWKYWKPLSQNPHSPSLLHILCLLLLMPNIFQFIF